MEEERKKSSVFDETPIISVTHLFINDDWFDVMKEKFNEKKRLEIKTNFGELLVLNYAPGATIDQEKQSES